MRKLILLLLLAVGCGNVCDDQPDAGPADARVFTDAGQCASVDCADPAIDRITFRDCCNK